MLVVDCVECEIHAVSRHGMQSYSPTLSPHMDWQNSLHCPTLHYLFACTPTARELLLQDIDRRRSASHPLQHARTCRVGEPQLKLIAVKGPGDSLGPPFVQQRRSISGAPRNGITSVATDHRWRVYVRARGPVTAFRARLEDLVKLVEQHPEMEGAMKQMGTAQETDMMVAEAMRQLRLLNDVARPPLVDTATAMTVSG